MALKLLLWATPLLMLLVQALRLWLRLRVNGSAPAEGPLRAERAAVEAQKALLHPVRDFVLVSKLGRRLVDLDKRLAAAGAARAAAAAAPSSALPLAYAHYAAIFVVSAAGWGSPLLPLPAGWFAPGAWLLSISAGRQGALGVLPWALLCSAVLEAALAGATGTLWPDAASETAR